MKNLTREFLWVGDELAKTCDFDKVIEAYQLAGWNGMKRLVELGRQYEAKHELSIAIRLYKAGDAKEELIALGDRHFAEAVPQASLEAFIAAGATQKLVALGDWFMKQDERLSALRAYQAAGAIAKIVRLGKDALGGRHKNPDLALEAFKVASIMSA